MGYLDKLVDSALALSPSESSGSPSKTKVVQERLRTGNYIR
jgi:hypothetical protein